MIVACVGKRDLTPCEQASLVSTGTSLAQQSCIITTGGAPGADQAFADGASRVRADLVELYLPWHSFEKRQAPNGARYWTAKQATSRHIELAEAAHPAWPRLSNAVRQLMIRNAMIVMRFDRKVDFVVAMPNRQKNGWGGTGHTLRVAAMLNVPTFLLDTRTWWDHTGGQPCT